MSETKVGEAKPDGNQRVRKVSRNRKKYGEIRHYPNKVTVYWTERRRDQFHRLTGGWLVEVDTISAVRNYGATHVGLLIEDGTKMLTRIATFGAEGKAAGVECKRSDTYVDPWGNRGAMCWHVPQRLWSQLEPPEDIRSEYLRGQMHIKRARAKRK